MTTYRIAPRARLILILTGVLFVGVLIPLASVARADQSAHPKTVLVFYWGSVNFPANTIFDQNFRATLQSAPERSVEYYSEYLDSDRFPGEMQSLLAHDYLRQKYADHPVDVVVAFGDIALDFLLNYRDDLFAHTPIVFVAVKPPEPKEFASGPGLTGIIQRSDYRKTLDVALSLHPDTEQVFIVSGSLDQDKRYEKTSWEELKGYENRVAITHLTDLPPDELIAKTKSLPDRSIVLYVWQQSRDELGKILESPDVLALFAPSTRVPIYGLANWQVGRGIVGGSVRNFGTTATRSAELVLRIANGERAQDIPVENVPTLPMFDWRELKRWGISEESLPPGSIVWFRAPSFWDQYKWYAIGLVSVIVGESLLIAGLVVNRRWRKRAEVDRRRAQLEVEESRARLAGIIGSAMDGIVSIDESQRIVLFNRAAQKMFGCTEQEVIGQTLDRFLPERFRESHLRHIRDFGNTNVSMKTLESMAIRGCRLDGEEFPIEASISQLELHGKKFYTVILRDITKRQQATEALRESEERFRNMADTAPVLIWIAGSDKLCTYFNQQWLNFTGRTLEEELGNGWTEGIHPDDYERCLETYKTAFDKREPFTTEYRLRRVDGEYCWVVDSGIPRFSPGGKFLGYIGSCIDISEHKAAEQAMRKSETALRESYHRIEDLAGRLIVAQEEERKHIARELHDDLHQQVAALSIGLDMLERQLPESADNVRNELRGFEDRTTKLAEWIRNLSHELHSSTLEHVGLAEALKLHCSRFSEQQGITLTVNLNGGLQPLQPDVALCLYRVAQEALRNIAKHSGAKRAELTLAENDGSIELRIADKGLGFDLNRQGRREGLGLPSMEERVRLVGGKLDIKSKRGAGTELRVYVPFKGRS